MILALACTRIVEIPVVLEEVTTLAGRLQWDVTFADGASPCSYGRTYGAEEDHSVGWLCPDCDVVWRAEAVMDGTDCYERISSTPGSPSEWLGRDGDRWFRSSIPHYSLTEQGVVTGDDVLVVDNVADVTEEGSLSWTLTVSGELAVESATLDPWHGLRPPPTYRCGWPKADPPPYAGNYVLEVGARVPDGVFGDACGDGLRLHDLADRWVVVEASAMDCGPCQSAAAEEQAFIDDLARDGIEVVVLTLLTPSLDDVLAEASLDERLAWTDTFALEGPVVGDRGWAVAVMGPALGEAYAYPSWVLVDPNRVVRAFEAGYSGWDVIADRIRD